MGPGDRRFLQNLRQAIKACRAGFAALAAAGRTEASLLGAGDFTRVLEAISSQRRGDGSEYSASFRNVLVYRFRE